MSRLDRALSRLAERGDPIGSDLLLERLERRLIGEAAPKVVALETRREPMSVTTERPVEKSPKKRTRRRNLALALGAAVIVAAASVSAWLVTDGSSDVAGSDPAAVLADYLEVWNAEDAEAVMAFYAEDAVLEGHPSDHGEKSTGKSEILVVEAEMNFFQGSTGSMEIINIEVSGDTVTFDNIFHNAQGQCFSSTGSEVTVTDSKIARYVWGDTDADLCG